VTIGRPGESLPPLGAARAYLSADADEWKEAVAGECTRAPFWVSLRSLGRGDSDRCKVLKSGIRLGSEAISGCSEADVLQNAYVLAAYSNG
jgi:hypothetical protein